MRVLVCDDEPQSARALTVVLRGAGFDVELTRRAEAALDRAAVRPPDAAIVELRLPDGDGADLCRRLREWSSMALIVVSAVDDEHEKVRALEAGADDYVTKPFAARELVARLAAILRRAQRGENDTPSIDVDGLQIDLAARVVRRDGEEVHLTPIESGCSAGCSPPAGGSSPTARCCATCGARRTSRTPPSSAPTSRTCGATSSAATACGSSAPSTASATASRSLPLSPSRSVTCGRPDPCRPSSCRGNDRLASTLLSRRER